MKRKIAITLIAAGLALGMMTSATAQTSEQETEVTVTVDEQAIVDVRPSSLDYTEGGDFPETGNSALAPGESRSISDKGFEHIDISNIGSVDIDQVTAEADMPNATPFAGSATPHNTGNLVTLSTATAESNDYTGDVQLAQNSNGLSENPHYLTRVEYAEDNPPEYIQVEQDGDVAGSSTFETDVGRFRVGDLEYFFVAYYQDGMTGSTSDYELRIGQAPHTSTTLGTTDFTNSGSNYINYTGTDVNDVTGDLSGVYGRIENQQFVVFDPDEGSNSDNYTGQNLLATDGTADYTSGDFTGDYVREYNLFTNFDSGDSDNHIQRTRFNTQVYDATTDGTKSGDRATEDTSGAQTPLVRSGGDPLSPGQNVPINIGVQLPQGIDSDNINSGIVRFVVTQDAAP